MGITFGFGHEDEDECWGVPAPMPKLSDADWERLKAIAGQFGAAARATRDRIAAQMFQRLEPTITFITPVKGEKDVIPQMGCSWCYDAYRRVR
jgi:hypothetical protein